MQVQFQVGTSLVQISGSASSVARIRSSIDYIEHMQPMFEELDEIKKILPVAGSGNAVLTIRAMAAEIAKLRRLVQLQHNVKEVVVEDD